MASGPCGERVELPVWAIQALLALYMGTSGWSGRSLCLEMVGIRASLTRCFINMTEPFMHRPLSRGGVVASKPILSLQVEKLVASPDRFANNRNRSASPEPGGFGPGIPFVIEAHKIHTLLEFSVAFWTSYGSSCTRTSPPGEICLFSRAWTRQTCDANTKTVSTTGYGLSQTPPEDNHHLPQW